MTKRAFNKIMRGVLDARAYLDGTADKTRYRVHYAAGGCNKKRVRPSAVRARAAAGSRGARGKVHKS